MKHLSKTFRRGLEMKINRSAGIIGALLLIMMFTTVGNRALAQSGNVGIGVEAPLSLLHVNHASDGDTKGIRLTSGTANTVLYHQDGDFYIRKLNEPNQLVLKTNGKVGIGTNTPLLRFSVNGNAEVFTESTTGVYREFRISGAKDGGSDAYGGLAFENYDLSADSMYVGAYVTSNNFSAGTIGDLRFWTRDNSGINAKMILTPAGRLGVGVTSPTEQWKLEEVSR